VTAFRDHGWLNGASDAVHDAWQAEANRHLKAMHDNPLGHNYVDHSEGNVTDMRCTCGFAWKADAS